MVSTSVAYNWFRQAALLMTMMVIQLTANAYAAKIGTLQFVSGDVELNQKPASLNQPLTVGSIITTGSDGFVHVRFIDNAFVSLRPGSTLLVKAYNYDQSRPSENRVEFKLEQGTMRSITGRSGESNKAGFMLNTPVAAIGIRGTDFVTVTNQQNTQVRVVSGAVIMRSGTCLGGTANCWNENHSTLSANSTHYLEVNQGQQPTLKSLLELPDDSPLSEQEQPPINSSLKSDSDDNVTLEHTSLELAEFDGEQQLDWGRWRGNHTVLQPPTPLVSDKYGAGKEMIASTNTFGLMRNQSDSPMQFWPSHGTLDLTLTSGEAHLRKDDRLFAASINQGGLTLDFNNNRFSTQLSGSESYNNSKWQLQGSGNITSEGLLKGDPGNSADIKGGLSTEGHQAGYLFSLPIDSQHSLEGATLWSR